MKGGEERQEGQVRKTYRLVRPLRRLRLELRAVPNLQRSRRPPREEIRDLLPRQALVLLQVDQELVVFGRKLELGPSRLLRWRGHPRLADHAWRPAASVVVSHHLGWRARVRKSMVVMCRRRR